MKIEFTDKRFTEFSQGMGFHLKNEGKPIDVSAANGTELLNHKQPPPDNPAAPKEEWINTFVAVGTKPKKVADQKALLAGYPEGFPHAKELTAAGFAHSDAVLLDAEALTAIDKIGAKGAEKIIVFNQEK